MVGTNSEREAVEGISLRIDIGANCIASCDSAACCNFRCFRNDKMKTGKCGFVIGDEILATIACFGEGGSSNWEDRGDTSFCREPL